jgi:hypothetical protein
LLFRFEESGFAGETASQCVRFCRGIGFFVILTVAIAGFVFDDSAWSAPPNKPPDRNNESVQVNAPPGQIGDSGYVVPTPEIKMRSIIGDRPPVRPAPKEPEVPAEKQPGPPVQPAEEEFQPDNTNETVPHSQLPAATEVPVDAGAGTQEPARLPFDPAARVPGESPRKTGVIEPDERDEVPPFKSPQAPEPVVEAPPPRKETLKRKPNAPTVPALLENLPVKEGAKAVPMESLRMGSTDSGASINLETRKEPEMAPEIPSREPLPEPAPAPSTRPELSPRPPEETAPEPVPAAPSTTVIPPAQPEPLPREAVPMVPPSEPIEETVVPKETMPPVEELAPSPKERFPSPLDQDALHSREVKEYLKHAAPILEELSLLMTRAPLLSVSDYDPSDPATSVVPKELYLKMDSLKRELQILDSKTFSIIPPQKYLKFHNVIRESITSTYQACDAMLAYFKESSPQNLQKVLTSLARARELIRRTRTSES